MLIWRGHYRFSRRYGLEDPYTVFLNVVLLFLVLFFVYPLKFVFTMLFEELSGHDVGMGFHTGCRAILGERNRLITKSIANLMGA